MLLLCALVVGNVSVWADEVTFTPGTDTGETSVTKGLVTATMTTMNNVSYYQIYANQSGTFSVTNGNITKIEFTCTASGTSKYGPGNASADKGTYSYSGNKGTWTGNATSVTISSTAQIRMSSLTITYTPDLTHTLAYTVSPAECGSVEVGSTSIGEGKTTTITATPNDGYRFTSWSVSGTGASVVSTTTNPTTFTMGTSDATVTANFEAIPTHTLTVTPTSAGTITVKNGEDEVASGSSVREGTELTIIAAAGVGKKFNSWSLTGATPASSTSTETTFTVGENDVTVAANFDDVTTYPVHWSVNGVVVATDNVAENDPISFDAPESGIPAGYKFTGWVAAANRIDGTTTTEPTANYVTSANATAEVTYYAVLVDIKTPDELTSTLTGVTGTSYTSWSGKKSISDAVYAGQSAANYSSIQLRSDKSTSGVITTTSGGKAKKVIIEWNSNTSATRTLTIYGKNTAYSSATDLYGANSGTSLGDLNVDDAVNHKSVLNITGDYEYIGIRSKSGALYLDKITIYWNEVENYCTTVPTATINLAAACKDGDKCYGTYSNSKAFIVPADLTVYEVSVVDGELYMEEYDTDDVVPANTGVLVAGTAGDHDVMLSTGGTSKLGSGNLLRASGAGINAAAMAAADASCKFYRLTMHEGTQIGFFWGAENGAAFDVAANKAYLAVPTGQTGEVRGFSLNDGADAISEIMKNEKMSAIYDLSGRRVVKPTKGLYIVNGKKVVK